MVYSLKVGDDWRESDPQKPNPNQPEGFWEVYAATPWNYAIDVNEASIGHLDFENREIGDYVISPDGAPISTTVKGRRVKDWVLENGSAGPVPSPPFEFEGQETDLTLIPYGCTTLRITEFPLLPRKVR